MRKMPMKLTALCLLFAFFVAPAFTKPQSGSQDNQTAPLVKKKKKPKEKPASAEGQVAAPSGTGPASSNGPAAGAPASAAASTKSSKAAVGGIASDAEIAAAKASGKVWVNLDTGIYHKAGRWYGKTKNGKFMTADEAKKAGYRPAKRD
jgi:hypothetical protein